MASGINGRKLRRRRGVAWDWGSFGSRAGGTGIRCGSLAPKVGCGRRRADVSSDRGLVKSWQQEVVVTRHPGSEGPGRKGTQQKGGRRPAENLVGWVRLAAQWRAIPPYCREEIKQHCALFAQALSICVLGLFGRVWEGGHLCSRLFVRDSSVICVASDLSRERSFGRFTHGKYPTPAMCGEDASRPVFDSWRRRYDTLRLDNVDSRERFVGATVSEDLGLHSTVACVDE